MLGAVVACESWDSCETLFFCILLVGAVTTLLVEAATILLDGAATTFLLGVATRVLLGTGGGSIVSRFDTLSFGAIFDSYSGISIVG